MLPCKMPFMGQKVARQGYQIPRNTVYVSFLQALEDYHEIPFGKDVFFYKITKYHEIPVDKGGFFYKITTYHEVPYGCWCAGEVMTKLGIDGRKCHRRRLPVIINFSKLAVIINFHIIYPGFYVINLGSSINFHIIYLAVIINFYIICLGFYIINPGSSINFHIIYMAFFINFYIIYLGSRHHKTIHTCKGFHSTYLCC